MISYFCNKMFMLANLIVPSFVESSMLMTHFMLLISIKTADMLEATTCYFLLFSFILFCYIGNSIVQLYLTEQSVCSFMYVKFKMRKIRRFQRSLPSKASLF